eukprot:7385754-Prymnesium_polylepis.2
MHLVIKGEAQAIPGARRQHDVCRDATLRHGKRVADRTEACQRGSQYGKHQDAGGIFAGASFAGSICLQVVQAEVLPPIGCRESVIEGELGSELKLGGAIAPLSSG